MACQTTFIAQFAVYMTVRDIEAQLKLYTDYGFIVEKGWDAVEDAPDEYFMARGISRSDVVATKALKLPADPYMHLILTEFKFPREGPKWPATYDQLGSRAHAFLVGSVATEIARIEKEFPTVRILGEPVSVDRKWGRTTTALMLDPYGVFFEIVEIDRDGGFFSGGKQVPSPREKAWLHFMLNSDKVEEQLRFYQSFDLVHDSRVDFRHGIGFEPYGLEKFAKEHYDSMGMKMEDCVATNFLRNLKDPSEMHLELLEYKPGTLRDPNSSPSWPMKGIARFCFRTPTKDADLERAKCNEHKILIEDSKICVNWGDSEYFYFADADGNILTSEQWHHWGYFGMKS